MSTIHKDTSTKQADERTQNATNGSHHTPGPWKIRKREGKFTQVFILDAANKGAIAEISPFGNVENGWVHEANARLIAAAPELLETLRAIVKAANRQTIVAATHKRSEGQVLIADARAAIAKAEGRAQ